MFIEWSPERILHNITIADIVLYPILGRNKTTMRNKVAISLAYHLSSLYKVQVWEGLCHLKVIVGLLEEKCLLKKSVKIFLLFD